MIHKVITSLKSHIAASRAYARKKRARELKEEYEICEHNGHIYLLHMGNAIRKFSPYDSSATIINALKEARKARLIQAGLISPEPVKPEIQILSFSKIGTL